MTDLAPRRRPTHAGSWVLCVGLGLLLAVPMVAAEPIVTGEFRAASAETTTTGTQAGTIHLLRAARGEGDAHATPTVHIEADKIVWTQTEDEGPAATVPSATGGDDFTVSGAELKRTLDPAGNPQPVVATNAVFDVQSAQTEFLLHVHTLKPVDSQATTPQAGLTSLQRPYISKSDGIRESQEGYAEDDPASPPPSDFTQMTINSRMVRTVPDGDSRIALRGDFVLEIWGLSGTMRSNGQASQVQSGTWKDAAAPGAPTGNVYEERRLFVRMVVTGGNANFSFQHDMGAQWAGPASSLVVSGPVLLAAATGHVALQDGQEVTVQAARYSLSGHNAIQLSPQANGLLLGVTGLDAEGNPLTANSGTLQSVPGDLLAAGALAFALVAALAAGVWFAQRRLRRLPALPDVEAALESGHYRRAARDAGRILRRKPGMETALISRAIALSKAGRNQLVVDEVETHLANRSPSDGVLHYVLGIAYADLGKAKEAEAAFQEAVRRTPALLSDVQGRLPAGSSVPAPSTKSSAETHGYA